MFYKVSDIPSKKASTYVPENVAVKKSCSMSSRYEDGTHTSGNCSAAINGNNDTNFDLSNSPPNCIHTRCDDFYPFWSVDLGKIFSVHRIIIYARTGCKKHFA